MGRAAPDAAHGRRIRPPQTDADKTLVGRQVDVVARCVDILAGFMSELDADVGFVWGFVFGETRVAIYTHERTTDFLRNGGKVRGDER